MTQKGKPIKFYILFFLGMFAVIYLLKYAANSRDLTAEHFAGGFLQTLSIFTLMTYSYYLSDRRSTLPKEEFKAIRNKSMLIVFFSACTIVSGVGIIENILLHTEIKWLKLIEISLGLSTISILFAIIMTKLIPIKSRAKTEK
jgi:hypothetical protein